MEFQQLRYVLALAETRNFTRAAERCFVVQSALSQQIAKLEQEVGASLFERSNRQVTLTEAGHEFLPWARASLDAADRASAEAAAAAGVIRGPQRIGLVPTASALDVPHLIRQLRIAHPELEVQLSMRGSNELISAVQSRSLDLAVVGLARGLEPKGVSHRLLATDALVAVVPHAMPWSTRTFTTIGELAKHPFVDFPAGTPGREQSDHGFAEAGLTRDVPFEVTTPEHMQSIIAAELAVALLPRAFAEGPGVHVLEVRGAPERSELLIWAQGEPSAVLRATLEVLDDELARSDAPTKR